MGDFGFDANLINNATSAFGRGMDSGLNTATGQANLGQLLYHQQRERTLADFVRQGVPLEQAYQRIGDPQGMMEAQQRAFEMQQRSFELGQKILGIHQQVTSSRLSAASTPAQVRQVFGSLPQDMVDRYGAPGKDASDADVLAAKEGFLRAQITPEKQAELQAKRDALEKERYGITTSEATGAAYLLDKTKGTVKTLGGGAQAQVPLDPAARQYLQTGEMPDLGRDPAGLLHKAILKRAQELDPGANVAANRAQYKSDSASLERAQAQADAVNGFSRTFDKNLGVLQESLGKLGSSNSPLANKGLRYLQEHGTGDPNFTAFSNALNTVRSELGKINSGSTGQGGVPISVLDEMEKGLPVNATPAQVFAALKVYRKDSENRRAAMQEQIDEIKGRMGGKGSGGKGAKSPGVPPGITHLRTVNGETRGWDGTKWVPMGAP